VSRGDDEHALPQVYTYYGPSVNGVAFVARLASALADVTNAGETHTPGYETIKPPRACLEMYVTSPARRHTWTCGAPPAPPAPGKAPRRLPLQAARPPTIGRAVTAAGTPAPGGAGSWGRSTYPPTTAHPVTPLLVDWPPRRRAPAKVHGPTDPTASRIWL
jgi:hypothetical protein